MTSFRDTVRGRRPRGQMAPIAGREAEMVPNAEGGYVFALPPMTLYERFLTLGSASNTYYASQGAQLEAARTLIMGLLPKHGLDVVEMAVAVSEQRRAYKNDPALFALALALSHGDVETKRRVGAVLRKAARTGTHLLHFVAYVDAERGWGRAARRAVSGWYDQPSDNLAYQMVKYPQRDGWSHRDVLRKVHLKPASEDHDAALGFALYRDAKSVAEVNAHDHNEDRLSARGTKPTDPKFEAAMARAVKAEDALSRAAKRFHVIRGAMMLHAKKVGLAGADLSITEHGAAKILEEFPDVPMEAIPKDLMRSKPLWNVLVRRLPIMALVRNLGKIGSMGILYDRETRELVLDKMKKAGPGALHPFQWFLAAHTYGLGRGLRGSLTWDVMTDIAAALEWALDRSMGVDRQEDVGKTLIAIDTSGSMTTEAMGTPIGCWAAAAGIARVLRGSIKQTRLVAFGTTIREFQSVDEASKFNGGGTDLALPVRWAAESGWDPDGVVILTDNVTWAGNEHATQALARLRAGTGKPVRLAVLAMALNGGEVVDPKDQLQLGVSGLDANAVSVVMDHLRGRARTTADIPEEPIDPEE